MKKHWFKPKKPFICRVSWCWGTGIIGNRLRYFYKEFELTFSLSQTEGVFPIKLSSPLVFLMKKVPYSLNFLTIILAVDSFIHNFLATLITDFPRLKTWSTKFYRFYHKKKSTFKDILAYLRCLDMILSFQNLFNIIIEFKYSFYIKDHPPITIKL